MCTSKIYHSGFPEQILQYLPHIARLHPPSTQLHHLSHYSIHDLHIPVSPSEPLQESPPNTTHHVFKRDPSDTASKPNSLESFDSSFAVERKVTM